MKEFWTSLASLMGVYAFFQNILHAMFPPELRLAASKFFHRVFLYFSTHCYFEITEIDGVNTNELYNDVQLYLSRSASVAASRLSLTRGRNSSAFTFGLTSNEHLVDTFRGATASWEHVVNQRQSQTISWRPIPEEKRSFTLRIKKKHKPLLVPAYLDHITMTATELRRQNEDRLLYTNSRGSMDSRGLPWESVPFKHPSTFETLAMDPARKELIMADLKDFAEGKAFYEKTGRAWKRGYLLYGPPGTGKSSMIAAMANYLGYDVYDLELTEVQTNSELRKLLMKTTSKSIIVIEDIDCSINLSNRGSKKTVQPPADLKPSGGPEDVNAAAAKTITLSGLLNFTDGLWSCCGSERIFVFTTNHVDKLDPALLRSGRMDMHILMGYCSFPALKILMKNYLGLEDGEFDDKPENSELLRELEAVIEEAEMTPADVSEFLIKNRRRAKRDAAAELLEVLKTRAEKRKKERGGSSAAARKKSSGEDVEEEEEQEKRALESPKESGQVMDECSGNGKDEKGKED